VEQGAVDSELLSLLKECATCVQEKKSLSPEMLQKLIKCTLEKKTE
jgi:hypothetical protein